MTYVWRWLALTQSGLGLVGLLFSVAMRFPLDEGNVVIVRAGWTGQNPHEVTIVAEILKKARHSPKETHKHIGAQTSRGKLL